MYNDDISIICESCGGKNAASNAYCASCGARLGANILEVRQEYQEEDTQNDDKESKDYGGDSGWNQGSRTTKPVYNIQFDINEFDERFFDPSDKEVSNFLTSNQDYYFAQFNKMRDFNKNTSWNWVAFFFPVIWFAYRKMYLLAVLVAVASSVLNSILSSAFVGNLVVGVALGLFGNIKYLEHMQNTFIEAEALRSESSRQSYLNEKGGTSMLAAFVAFIVTTGTILIPLIIFSSIFSGLIGMGMFYW